MNKRQREREKNVNEIIVCCVTRVVGKLTNTYITRIPPMDTEMVVIYNI